MELLEQIRREYKQGVGTIKGVAQKFGVHRRMVREAIGSAVPKPRKQAKRERAKMAPVIPWIEGILVSDQKAPRKQRHTAHRIWCRLRAERPEWEVAESTVRQYVRKRKIELGLAGGEVFVPQTYQWGQEGQVDWYEKPTPRSTARSGKSMRSACAAWRAAGRFIGPIHTPASRRFWKRTNWHSSTLAGCSRHFDSII